MSDCGVCLDSGYDETPTLYNDNFFKARKSHRCCECGRQIAVGSQYQRVEALWDGNFDTYKTCMDWWNIREAFRCGGGFLFERLWDDLNEYKNDINFDCVKNIKTPSAKAYYLERLREMRGIEE